MISLRILENRVIDFSFLLVCFYFFLLLFSGSIYSIIHSGDLNGFKKRIRKNRRSKIRHRLRPHIPNGLVGSLNGGSSGVMDSTNTVNIHPDCKYKGTERAEAITKMVEKIAALLESAKVVDVNDLEGKPVEVTLDGNIFHSFRILEEVL